MTRERTWRVPSRGELSRDELVRVGMDVLLEQGWSRLTVRGVASRAGTSPSHLCYHFGGVAPFRRLVVTEVVLDMLRPALQAMTSASSWQEGVVAVLHQVADEAVRARDDLTAGYDDLVGYGSPGPSQRHVLADLVVASLQDAVVREIVQESLDLARKRLTCWLEGLGVPDQHLAGVAVLLVALVDGLLLHHQLDPALALGEAGDALLSDVAAGPSTDREAA